MTKMLRVIDDGTEEIYIRRNRHKRIKSKIGNKTLRYNSFIQEYYMNGHRIENTKPYLWGCEGYLVSFLDIVDYGIALGATNIQIIGDRCFIFSLKETMVVNIYDLYDAIKMFKENEDNENIDMIEGVDCILCDSNKAIIARGTKSSLIDPIEIMIGAIKLDDDKILDLTL